MTKVIGSQVPRLQSVPECDYSIGKDIVDFSAEHGLSLDPWQALSLENSLGVRVMPDNRKKWSSFEVLEIVPRQNGKGSILEARELGGLFLIPTDRLILHTAHEHKTSAEHYLRIRSLIQNSPELEKKVLRSYSAYGREFIQIKAEPTIIFGSSGDQIRRHETHRIMFIARSGGSGRGFTGDCIVYDECMILDAAKVSASMPSVRARPNPQIWYTGSAGLSYSIQQARVRRRGISGKAKFLCFMEWSINPHTEFCQPNCTLHDDVDSIESIIKSNPGYGIRIDDEMIERERESFDGDPEGYAREILGVGTYPAEDDSWIVVPKKWWTNTADNTEDPPKLRSVAFSIDISPDRSHSAIGIAGTRVDGKTGIELVEYHAGTNWIIDRAVEINKRYPRSKWIIDPHSQAGSLIDELERQGIAVEKVTATDVAYGCGQFYDGLRDGWLIHLNQKPLTKALAGAEQRQLMGQWAWDRKNSSTDICPLMAVTFALWGYQKFGGHNYNISQSVHFGAGQIIRMMKAGLYGQQDIDRLKTEGLLTQEVVIKLREAGINVSI